MTRLEVGRTALRRSAQETIEGRRKSCRYISEKTPVRKSGKNSAIKKRGLTGEMVL